MCANHSRYRVTAQVPRAALALSEAAHGLTVACLPFTDAGQGFSQLQPGQGPHGTSP